MLLPSPGTQHRSTPLNAIPPNLELVHVNDSQDALKHQYQTALQEIDDAYLHDDKRRAQRCLRRAFDLSIRLLERGIDTSEAIQRLLEASRYYIDFGPVPDEDGEHYPLEIVGECLSRIVEDSSHPNWLRSEALIAFSEIAPVVEQLARFRQSKRPAQILRQFQVLWTQYQFIFYNVGR